MTSDFKKPDGKYILYCSNYTGEYVDKDDGYEGLNYEIYGIKADGTRETIYSLDGAGWVGYETTYSNAFSWVDHVRPRNPFGHVYSADEDKVYNLSSGELAYIDVCGNPDVGKVSFERIYSRLYDKKVVGYFSRYSDGELQADSYALISVDDGSGKSKVLSKPYKSMSTHDGEIYLVQNAENKWGYIDSNGNEIAFFDDASSFIGDYATVVMNGKGYLIDRNMYKVSEEIDAIGTSTIDKGLYFFKKPDNSYMLVTYSNETVAAPETSKPESSSESSTVSESSSESNSAPVSSSESSAAPVSSSAPQSSTSNTPSNNPGTGAAAVSILPIVAAVSAVVIISKKKK